MSSPDSSSSDTSSSSNSSSIVFDPVQLLPTSSQPPQPITTDSTINPELLRPSSSTNHDPSSSSQSTHLNLSLSGDFDQSFHRSQSTNLTSIPSTLQNSQSTNPSSSNPSQPNPNHNNHPNHPHPHPHLTAPPRVWMSQRKGKSIHIEDHHPSTTHDHLIDHPTIHPTQKYTDSPSSQRIIELGIIQDQLAQLLNLASEVLGSLSPPLDDIQSTNLAADSFSSSINEYFDLLNKIQLGLRTSMSHLRVSRISTRILFEPAHSSVPNCPVGLGDLNLTHLLSSTPSEPPSQHDRKRPAHDDDRPILSLGSLVAERNAWKDLVESLELIKATGSI